MSMISQPAPMTSANQILPMGSPYYIKTNTGTNYDTCFLSLWIWKGSYSARTNTQPDYLLKKEKTSIDDTYILFEISELVKPRITPDFTALGSPQNETVWIYWEVVYHNSQTSSIINTTQSKLHLATLGWSWNYQNQTYCTPQWLADYTINTDFGYDNINSMKHYKFVNGANYWTTKIANIGAINNSQVFSRTTYTPPIRECVKDPYLITFLNKGGLFETFTTTGKAIVSQKISSDKYVKTFRNPLDFRNGIDHREGKLNLNSVSNYTINTGNIDPILVNKIEEILVSPSVYLTNITTNEKMAVMIEDSTFVRKTLINDKNKMNYTIKFVETNNKVKSII